MSAAVRCLLALTVLLTGAAAATAGQPGDGTLTVRTVAADPMDTSWGDHYVKPQQ
ncbi:hypothetical protein [Streptomyces showdoensis]|uniref:hypothetical protein n=1 Tax=Streptomyces showdoensis TaxID=68268 RepID=UPI0013F4DEA0|nr:hypothetical protein [Streptomyces showdoensis]